MSLRDLVVDLVVMQDQGFMQIVFLGRGENVDACKKAHVYLLDFNEMLEIFKEPSNSATIH